VKEKHDKQFLMIVRRVFQIYVNDLVFPDKYRIAKRCRRISKSVEIYFGKAKILQ